jgi:hypothetical protein
MGCRADRGGARVGLSQSRAGGSRPASGPHWLGKRRVGHVVDGLFPFLLLFSSFYLNATLALKFRVKHAS